MIKWSKTRRFNNLRYRFHSKYYNKEDAKLSIENLRKKGFNARFIKRTGKGFGYAQEPMYGIYVKKKA